MSPLLANIYLHYALDLWAQQWRKTHARGEMYIVRYADDFVMGFQDEQDARAMREALASRLAKFGLELHPDKTRVLRFGRFAREKCEREGRRRPETFDFLGFTHIAGDRPARRVPAEAPHLAEETEGEAGRAERRDAPAATRAGAALQHAWLSSVLRGHYRYYGVPTNSRGALVVPRARPAGLAPPAPAPEPTRPMELRTTRGASRSASRSRCRRSSSLALPPPRCAVDPRWEPGAGNPLAGFCPGGGPS